MSLRYCLPLPPTSSPYPVPSATDGSHNLPAGLHLTLGWTETNECCAPASQHPKSRKPNHVNAGYAPRAQPIWGFNPV